MDTVTLVNDQIDDGARLLAALSENGFSVVAACWVKTSEEGRWFLYIASDAVEQAKLAAAYRQVYALLESLPTSGISMSEIKLIGRSNPITKDVLDLQRRYPGQLPTRSRRIQLGEIATDEVYIYPVNGASFEGFDEVKERFPSAEVLSLTVDRSGVDAALFVGNLAAYRGKINQEQFEGKAPGTVLFMGTRASSESPFAQLLFVHRPEGWNSLFRAESNSWEEVVHKETGETLYKPIDFGPLAALKNQFRNAGLGEVK
jgi:hypothetical protein